MLNIGRVKKKFTPNRSKVISVEVEDYHINPSFIVGAYRADDKHLGKVCACDVLYGNYVTTFIIPEESFLLIKNLE